MHRLKSLSCCSNKLYWYSINIPLSLNVTKNQAPFLFEINWQEILKSAVQEYSQNYGFPGTLFYTASLHFHR